MTKAHTPQEAYALAAQRAVHRLDREGHEILIGWLIGRVPAEVLHGAETIWKQYPSTRQPEEEPSAERPRF
jgi:hypothetical protein